MIGKTTLAPIAHDVPPAEADGYAWCSIEDGKRVGWHLHQGARLAWAKPAWANGKVLLHVLGGLALEDGFEEEGCAFLIDPCDLMALGFDLATVGEDA